MPQVPQKLRLRSPQSKLRVTFPDGNVVCCSRANATMVATLNKIGSSRFHEIDLEVGHLPLVSREKYEKFEKYMLPLDDGWYVNTQPDTRTKYIQLQSINNKLELGLNVEIGSDFEPVTEEPKIKKKRDVSRMVVTFADGYKIFETTSQLTYSQCFCKFGLSEVKRRDLEVSGKKLITTTQQYANQIHVGRDCWLFCPATVKERVKVLKFVALMLHQKIEVELY